MEQVLLYILFSLLIFNVLTALPFVKIPENIKILGIGGSLFLSVLMVGFLTYSFYMYHISPVRFLGIDLLNFENSSYLLAVLAAYFLPVYFDREHLFVKRKGALFYYSVSLLLIAAGIVLPLEDALVLYFIGLIFLYFLFLLFSFYIAPKIWVVSRVMYVVVLVLLLLPHLGVGNEWVTKVYLIFVLIFTLLLVAPFFVNLWVFGLVRNLPGILLLPLFTVLFIGGFFQLSRFLVYAHNVDFYNITAMVGFLSALFSVFAAFAVKDFKEFLFFLLTSISGTAVTMLGLSRYVGDAYGIVSAFYMITVFIGLSGLVVLVYLNDGKRWNRVVLFLFALFSVAMAGFPPYSSFFSKIEFLSDLFSYRMWSWAVGFSLVWLLQAGVLLRWFAYRYGSVDFDLKIRVGRLWVVGLLVVALFVLAVLNAYYANGFWGLSFLMLYVFLIVYVVDVFLPSILSGLFVFVSFVLFNYGKLDFDMFVILGSLTFLFMLWTSFDKKSKGGIPMFWLLLSAIVGIWQASNIFIFAFWMFFGSLASFLVLLFNRYDQISVKGALSYLYLSLIGDFLIFSVLAYFYTGDSVPLLTDVFKIAGSNDLTAFVIFTGILMKLPVLGFQFWLEKISLEFITVAFYPLLIYSRFYLGGFACNCEGVVLPYLLIILIFSVIRTIDTDTIYEYLKNIISVSITLILIIFLIAGINLPVLIFIVSAYSFTVFLYFVSLFVIMAFDSDEFLMIGNLIKKNTGLGILLYMTFIWFYSLGVTGVFFSDYVVLKNPFVSYVVLLAYGVALAYFMYGMFAEGVDVKNTDRKGLSVHLFVMIMNTVFAVWILPFFYDLPHFSIIFLSIVFFMLLYFAFRHGNIATVLRASKFFEMVRRFHRNFFVIHFPKFLDLAAEVSYLVYRDNGGLIFNILLFAAIIFVFAW